jgi:predicted RNA binding protein YcfA (HicA-like mRNA interferase family)
MKRRDLVKILKQNGYRSDGGTKHEHFVKGKHTIMVKRHNEIEDQIAKKILKQAGLKF